MENIKNLIVEWQGKARDISYTLDGIYCGDVEAFIKAKKVAQLDECLTSLKLAYLKDGGRL